MASKKHVDPSQYLIKTGAFVNDLTICKKGWDLPFQRSTFFDITPANYTLELQAMSVEKLEFNLPAVFTIGPKDESKALERYSKLLAVNDRNIKELIRGIIEGETRIIAATMTMEEIFQEKKGFKEKVIKNRMKTHEGAVNQAKVDVAEAKYRGDVGAKKREGLTRREISKIEADTILIENERKVAIARANMNLATKESEFERTKNVAAIEATQTVKMRESELQKQVEERLLLSETDRFRVKYVSKSTAEFEAAKSNANARLYEKQKEAEAELFKKQKEAEGILAVYNAQAQGIKNLMDAFEGDCNVTHQYIMIERGVYQQLAKESAIAIHGLNPNITVWNTGKRIL
ncbi:hypothetical protein C1645_800214 [Glomus cerebriforme]|uniref:Band 7 domain-containing protein n=1 Tax=Glomus cerebriforme TaxID=658196 RepID=A0A397SF07_9GLOM|nr:hypothetical protein C1645_800214 [Glomus cerebriforme]